jgi:NADPH-dependent 2,4-dienoyl-CoA reductase/sulfur reductase-like enzyme
MHRVCKNGARLAIVIGGGEVGLETADYLVEAGKKVIVLEMLGEVGIDMPPRPKMFLMKKHVIKAHNTGIRY